MNSNMILNTYCAEIPSFIIPLLHHNKVTWKLGNIYRELTTRHIRTPKDSVCTPGWQYVQGQKKRENGRKYG